MLTSIRKGLNSFVVTILVGLLIASFAIFGVGDIFRGQSLAVATVGDTDVSATDFLREFDNRIQSYQAQLGPEFTKEQARDMGLDQQVLSSLIARTVLDNIVNDMGMRSSNKEVRDEIQNIEAFKGMLGDFDDFSYKSALQRVGLSPRAFEKMVRSDISRSRLVDAVALAHPLPKTIADELYTYLKESRTVRSITVSASDMDVPKTPADQVLKDFHEFNSRLFMNPEYRDLDFVVLNPADFVAEDSLTDERLRIVYDERINEYQVSELRDIRVAIFNSKADAQAFIDRTKGGEDFVDVAVDMTDFAADELSLGEKTYYDLEKDYNTNAAEMVFALANGGISQPVETLMTSWQVFQVTNVTAENTRLFEDVREELVARLAEEIGTDALYDLTAKIDDAIAGGSTLNEVAEEMSLEIISFKGLAINGASAAGGIAPDLMMVLPMLQDAFAIEMDQDLELKENKLGGYYMAQVSAITPPALRDFDDAKSEVLIAWTAQEMMARSGALSDTLLGKLQSGAEMNMVAKQNGLTVLDIPVLTRDSTFRTDGLGKQISNLIFAMKEGEFALEQTADGQGYVILHVTRVEPGNALANPAAVTALHKQLEVEARDDILMQFQIGAQSRQDVLVNRRLIDQILDPNA